jgi:hypothetical protein
MKAGVMWMGGCKAKGRNVRMSSHGMEKVEVSIIPVSRLSSG